MKARVLALLLLCFLALPVAVSASELFVGAVVSDRNGYSYTYAADGFFYRGDTAYSRVLWTQPGYWSYANYCRSWVPGYDFWVYNPVSVVTRYIDRPTLPSYKDPSWRSKLLDIAAARDRIEGDIRRGQFEQAYFMDAVSGLGLSGNFRFQNYGMSPPYATAGGYGAAAGAYGSQNFGANANTQYGYSYSTIASLYGDNNQAQLQQMVGQSVQGTQKLMGEANSGLLALTAQDGTNRAKVAEILARGEMAQRIISVLTGPSTVETKGFAFQIKPGGAIETVADPKVVTPEVRARLSASFEKVSTDRCASCHSGAEPKGKFLVADYPKLSPAAKQHVWELLVTPDDKARMPKTPDGSPAPRLSREEMQAFVLN